MKRQHDSVTYTPAINERQQTLFAYHGPCDGESFVVAQWANAVEILYLNDWTHASEKHQYGVAYRWDAYTNETFLCLVWIPPC